VHVRVVEAGDDAAAAQVYVLGARRRFRRDPPVRDGQPRGQRRRGVERPDPPAFEDEAWRWIELVG
jgi:hypothetical protein